MNVYQTYYADYNNEDNAKINRNLKEHKADYV